MPPIVFDIFSTFGFLIRAFGMLVFGFAFSLLTVEFFKKGQQVWMLQIAIFLGFVGLVIALSTFTSPASLGAFGFGVGAGLLYFLMFKKEKGEEQTDESKN